MSGWFKSLSRARKAIYIFIVSIIALAAIGSVQPQKQSISNAPAPKSANATNTSAANTQKQEPAPSIEIKTLSETKTVPFKTTQINDATLLAGTSKVTTTGIDGVETIQYKVTYTNGVETGREQISDEITIQPINQVTSIGTYVVPKSNCDPNYTGCAPNVWPSDVDCAGGSGNGPYYVQGPVNVIGVDRYGLDRDGDGVACE